jgi:hypothetical protein
MLRSRDPFFVLEVTLGQRSAGLSETCVLHFALLELKPVNFWN